MKGCSHDRKFFHNREGKVKTTKQQRETRLIELVETHNLALALKRLDDAPYDTHRKRRAQYHALTMSSGFNRDELSKIREALNLP